MENIYVEMPDVMDTKQLSQLLGVPVPTIATWRHNGNGPRFLRLGGRVIRYRKTDVLRWIASSVVETTGETE